MWKEHHGNLTLRSKDNKRIRSISRTTLLYLVLHMLSKIDCEWNSRAETSLARQIGNLLLRNQTDERLVLMTALN